MWKEVFNLAINNGLWAVLFLALLIYVLKDSKIREVKYQTTIEKLADSLAVIEDVKNDVKKIKIKVFRVEKSVSKGKLPNCTDGKAS